MSTEPSTTPAADPADGPEVIVRRAGRLGHLVLNRPRALNALTPGMVDTVREALARWREDDGVRTVLVTGAGERGLCAGGDIVNLHRTVAEGHPEDADAFFDVEYTMNGEIADFPKPFVAFMDGIVLGGGVGISAHGSHRVVTERTRLGMPETGIGFFPDVGGSWLLSRADGFGLHMALTSQHVTGADAVALGFADHHVPAGRLPELAAALETLEADAAIAAVATDPPAAPLLAHRRWIEACYRAGTAEEIVAALEADGDPAAAEAAAHIRAKSPTSVKVTLELVRRAGRMRSVHEVLDQDRTVAHHLIRSADMSEGIRAQLVDKDRDPHWDPAALEDVRDADVAAVFAAPHPSRTEAVEEALS
ncbi:enoyl-CoA hydratase/isomerase family protein [Citricoccus sp. SGAir0253]|uniref:enoyl-CoA hydratase/isomerase family protein n=1 Tax=Citricoccus sp. SGAir0253 TaxID=2567881 RepID=UPI0010CCC7B3|nr:enoyl-CoA hydratase/isomerase family protein [Citricoccus sp. SGAir0253]QCU78993.1 enoyl-CoA hydratase/isomerase family protein [Citricoccus sp. SGAir0253]